MACSTRTALRVLLLTQTKHPLAMGLALNDLIHYIVLPDPDGLRKKLVVYFVFFLYILVLG
jgi:hypothetical protein